MPKQFKSKFNVYTYILFWNNKISWIFLRIISCSWFMNTYRISERTVDLHTNWFPFLGIHIENPQAHRKQHDKNVGDDLTGKELCLRYRKYFLSCFQLQSNFIPSQSCFLSPNKHKLFEMAVINTKSFCSSLFPQRGRSALEEINKQKVSSQ